MKAVGKVQNGKGVERKQHLTFYARKQPMKLDMFLLQSQKMDRRQLSRYSACHTSIRSSPQSLEPL